MITDRKDSDEKHRDLRVDRALTLSLEKRASNRAGQMDRFTKERETVEGRVRETPRQEAEASWGGSEG